MRPYYLRLYFGQPCHDAQGELIALQVHDVCGLDSLQAIATSLLLKLDVTIPSMAVSGLESLVHWMSI